MRPKCRRQPKRVSDGLHAEGGFAGARLVEAGAAVEANAAVTSIEAMKMQHAIVATRPARVVRWVVAPGAFVRAGQPMAELAPPAEEPQR